MPYSFFWIVYTAKFRNNFIIDLAFYNIAFFDAERNIIYTDIKNSFIVWNKNNDAIFLNPVDGKIGFYINPPLKNILFYDIIIALLFLNVNKVKKYHSKRKFIIKRAQISMNGHGGSYCLLMTEEMK